ncbi:response regulator [Clostridium tertium]|uniref:Stage 0 sporulation protein A homolog n=1 Tax=Clostridium tertium TaxID=1559 RepID=A0A6N3GSH9_9CLOT
MYKILHIENSNFLHSIVKEVVTKKGFEYISCDTYTEALIILDEIEIDLILTATNIIGMNINDFIEEVKLKNETLPICIVSSNDNSKILFDAGANNYISKTDLISELESYIDNTFIFEKNNITFNDKKIAIIDDNVLSILQIKDILQKYNSKNIYSFKSGIELFKSNKIFDIYLVDIILKDESGLNIIKKIRNLNPSSIIIGITALSNENTLSEVLDYGADDIVNKPVNEKLLISKIKARLR